MANIFKYKDQYLTLGQSWTDDNGILHPPNWGIWDSDYKTSMGMTELVPEATPDPRLYTWSIDSDGKVTSQAKSLDDSGDVLGVKSTLKNEVKEYQKNHLFQTDWAFIRKADKGTAVPTDIQTWRDAIRTKATEMEDAIDACSSVSDVEKLWYVRTEDLKGKVTETGILYNWPELES